tara:strand:- start:788 stop:1069 length:282 start_codon:yes stop_codon:yes gene_type:complete
MKVGDICTNGYDTVVVVRVLHSEGKNNLRAVIVRNGVSPTIKLSGVGKGFSTEDLTLVEEVNGFERYVANYAVSLFNKVVEYQPTITYRNEKN